jgi:hypothetical protein
MDDVERIAAAAAAYTAPGEEVLAVLAVEPAPGERAYLCAFAAADGVQSWLALADDGAVLKSRKRVHDAASIAALCEVAEEAAGVAQGEPRLASLEYLDSLGVQAGNGDLVAALQGAVPAVDELVKDIEANYRLELA